MGHLAQERSLYERLCRMQGQQYTCAHLVIFAATGTSMQIGQAVSWSDINLCERKTGQFNSGKYCHKEQLHLVLQPYHLLDG